MKRDGLTTILNVLTAICLILAAVFSFQVLNLSKELRGYNSQMNTINGLRANLQALAAECLEYSKHNPAIDPILESVNVKPAKSAPAKPAVK